MNIMENKEEWIVDLGTMTCRNINSRIVVEFQKTGKTYTGKIKDLPVEIMELWERLWYGDRLKQNTVMIAEKVFLRAATEMDIKNNGVQEV
jgi:hypothetical protein